MRAQFCVYVFALPLSGAHGCTGWFADKVKLTLLCTPLQTAYLLFLWCSHLCRNWYWGLDSKRLCLILPEFTMPLRHRCLNLMSSLCDWRRNHMLSHNLMIACLIPRKRNNPLLSSLFGLPFEYNFLELFHHHNLYPLIFAFIIDILSNFDENLDFINWMFIYTG